MAVTNRAGTTPVRRPPVPPDVRDMLEDSRRWNAYADRINQKALAAGIVTAETLAAARRDSNRAVRRILDNYCLDNDPDLRAWHEQLDRHERGLMP